MPLNQGENLDAVRFSKLLNSRIGHLLVIPALLYFEHSYKLVNPINTSLSCIINVEYFIMYLRGVYMKFLFISIK